MIVLEVRVNRCPCGSGGKYADCCGPYIAGTRAAPTAEALMRSRYTAHVKVEIDHIERTRAPDPGAPFDRAGVERWARDTRWRGLEIMSVSGGGVDDDAGVVEFIASYDTDQGVAAHHERSSFRRDSGRWTYVDGKIIREPRMNTPTKIGRNKPCPCGSGKKYKKCCGRP